LHVRPVDQQNVLHQHAETTRRSSHFCVAVLATTTPRYSLDNQTRLVEGIGGTIDLLVAEATAAQKALEKNKSPKCLRTGETLNILFASLARKSRP
ncbi:hypothetical protein AaE_002325, partial [Aphanomyces astaci]